MSTANGHHGDKSGKAAGRACHQAALEYLAFGWSPLVLCPPDHLGVSEKHARECTGSSIGKTPLPSWKDYQTRQPTLDEINGWWRRSPNGNVGVTLGGPGRLTRLDVDGPAGEAELARLAGGDLPVTPEFRTGRKNGGRGLLFAIPEGQTWRTKVEGQAVGQELRIQALGAQTALPPSRHKDGGVYAWTEGRSPRDIPVSPAPAWLVKLMTAGGETPRPAGPAEGEPIGEGHRDSHLTSMAGTMRRRGFSAEAILAALVVTNKERCRPPLPAAQVEKIAHSVGSYAPDPKASAVCTSTPPPTYQAILEHLHATYNPTFRRGRVLYSSTLSAEVRQSDACRSPGIELVLHLAGLPDAPRDRKGNVCPEMIPQLYRTWASVAYQDLVDELPEEDKAAEVAGGAAEQFRRAVVAALLSQQSLGFVHEGETTIQRRSLIDWCVVFATRGLWQDVRSFHIWTRRDPEDRLQIAVRGTLHTQVGPRELAGLSQRTYADLAERYDVGAAGKAGGQRCVILSHAFVRSVMASPDNDLDGWTDGRSDRAGARETCVHPSTDAQGDTAQGDTVDDGVDAANTRASMRPRTQAGGV